MASIFICVVPFAFPLGSPWPTEKRRLVWREGGSTAAASLRTPWSACATPQRHPDSQRGQHPRRLYAHSGEVRLDHDLSSLWALPLDGIPSLRYARAACVPPAIRSAEAGVQLPEGCIAAHEQRPSARHDPRQASTPQVRRVLFAPRE